MLFAKILIVLFSIKTCIGVVPRIVGGNEVSHKKQGNWIYTVKLRVLTRVFNMEINFFPKGHSK